MLAIPAAAISNIANPITSNMVWRIACASSIGSTSDCQVRASDCRRGGPGVQGRRPRTGSLRSSRVATWVTRPLATSSVSASACGQEDGDVVDHRLPGLDDAADGVAHRVHRAVDRPGLERQDAPGSSSSSAAGVRGDQDLPGLRASRRRSGSRPWGTRCRRAR